jgi:hypothetical protein
MSKVNSAALAFTVLVVLAGCGSMPEDTPTPASTQTTAPEVDRATPGTPEADELTFGDLADRLGAAWSGAQSYQVTFTGTAPSSPTENETPISVEFATPGATPLARPRSSYTTVREVQAPNRQHQTVTGLGADDHEAIAIGNQLFLRGPVVERIAPDVPPDVWIALDPSSLPDGALLLHLLGGLPEFPGAPLSTLPDRLRAQEVRALDSVEHDGRVCQVFAAADTVPATGMRVDYTIAIDENNIPCFVETGAGGFAQGRDEYTDIGAEFDIEPPIAATPVSVPPALATPIAHD